MSIPSKSVSSGNYFSTSQGKIGIWEGARSRGNTGIRVAEGYISHCIFEIPGVPDFSSSRFPDLANLEANARIAEVSQRQDKFLSALHNLGPTTSINLRYFYSPSSRQEAQIRLFLVGRIFDFNDDCALDQIEVMSNTIRAAFPAEYRLVDVSADDPDLERFLFLNSAQSIVELLKSEEIVPAWHDAELCGFSQYYLPGAYAANSNSMLDFCESLVARKQLSDILLDVSLIPTRSLTDVEKGEIRTWSSICDQWSRTQTVEKGGGLYSGPTKYEIQPDPNAKDVQGTYEDLLDTYSDSQKLFLYSIRVLSWSDSPPMDIATFLGSNALAPGSAYHLRPISYQDPVFTKALNAAIYSSVTPGVFNESIWKNIDSFESLRRLHRMVDLSEVSGFFRLPIPGRAGCKGVPLDSGIVERDFERSSVIHLGKFASGANISDADSEMPIADLAKSALVVGMPGSGKTSLCFSILRQLWVEHRIPFIVLEPAKAEYRSLVTLKEFEQDTWIFTPGSEGISPFRLNPFEIIPGVSVSEHISSLNVCFNSAFEMWSPLPMIFDEAIRKCYQDKGWSEYDVGGNDSDLQFPTIDDFYITTLEVSAQKSYEGETSGSIKGAIETRLGSLRRGAKGRCFNSRKSFSAEELMSRPVVLELDALNEEEKTLMMMFILNLVREYTKATRKSGSTLQHILLVEEAHNVLGRDDASSEVNPGKAKSIKFLTRMLAEMRALGEGIIIADQLPTAIAPEAIKNTNLKVMHRMVAHDDRQELGSAMLLDEGQMQQAAILQPGQSIIFMEGMARSRQIQEPNFKAMHEMGSPPENQFVRDNMCKLRTDKIFAKMYFPFDECPSACSECNSKLREEYERYSNQVIEEILNSRVNTEYEIEKQDIYLYYFKNIDLPDVKSNSGCSHEEKCRDSCARIHYRERVRCLSEG